IEKTIKYLADKKLDLKIVVEARSLSEVEEILQSDGVYRILLDNFNYDDTKKAVKLIDGRCFTESSGGITLENAKFYAECEVDYISSGALIHSVH
ncbi:nicotinate-nucleotide diphosphorylase, partial [Psychroflexus lacisalsi]|nr:nicotinate-nucleotide diphosphorylase (carboxylating) [Psychroflexus lacisalsi]